MLHLPNGLSLRAESSLLGASEKPSEHTEAIARLSISARPLPYKPKAAGMVTVESWFCWTPSTRFGGDEQGHSCARGDGLLREECWGRAHIPYNLCLVLHCTTLPLEITLQLKIC